MKDTCGCNVGGDCECLCTSLSAYAQACNHAGVKIQWRSQGLCGESFLHLLMSNFTHTGLPLATMTHLPFYRRRTTLKKRFFSYWKFCFQFLWCFQCKINGRFIRWTTLKAFPVFLGALHVLFYHSSFFYLLRPSQVANSVMFDTIFRLQWK